MKQLTFILFFFYPLFIFAQDWSGNITWLYSQEKYTPFDSDDVRELEKIDTILIDGKSCIVVEERLVTLANGMKFPSRFSEKYIFLDIRYI